MRKFNFLLISCFFLLISQIFANPNKYESQNNWEKFEGKKIDSIIIDNRNIFDSNGKSYDHFIFRLANRLHIKTTQETIRRELLFNTGDIFSRELIEETERILRQRLIIYDAWIEKTLLPNGHVKLRVVTIDRWSLAFGVEARREGNENRFRTGMTEKNLLGMNQYLSFHFIDQSDDDNYSEASYIDSRFLGYPLQTHLIYSSNPKNSFNQFYLSRPIYNLEQSFGFDVSFLERHGRNDVYEDNFLTAQSNYKGDRFETGITYRYGSYHSKLETNIGYRYNYEKSYNKQIYLDEGDIPLKPEYYFAEDSLSHTLIFNLKYSENRFIKLKNIDGYNYIEDFAISPFIEISTRKSYNNSFKKNLYNRISLSLYKNFYEKNNLILFSYVTKYWYHNSDQLRLQQMFAINLYNQSLKGVTFALRGQYLYDNKTDHSPLLILGGETGIRGYDSYYLTGDERIVINSEIRFHPRITILSVMFGGAIFADFGHIRMKSEPIRLDKFKSSIGAGLRIAFDKATRHILRFDFAYSKENNLSLSISSGMYFYARNDI